MASATNLGGNPELKQFLDDCIAKNGGIPFSEFMGHCLYHPEYGYYMAARDRIGKQGDFFTSTSVHAVFGKLIARQLHQMWEILGQGAFTVAEQGPGEGHLALDILNAIRDEFPDFYNSLRYCLVEISPDNRSRQKQQLSDHLDRVSWGPLEDLSGMEGCILSNELVDSFPVHLVEKESGGYKEVYVDVKDGEFVEELRPLSTPLIEEHFQRLGFGPIEGNRAEVNLHADRWMADVAEVLGRGFVLTIDYGYPAQELYSPLRRTGTLMCFHRHQTNENPYQRVGEQDITSHINFTALELVGQEHGLENLCFEEQAKFLLTLGFVDELMALQAREPNESKAREIRLILKNLILPEQGMGETFKVLVQGKGVGRPQLLCTRSLSELPIPSAAF